MRTRMYGGVGGEDGRLSPLSRLLARVKRKRKRMEENSQPFLGETLQQRRQAYFFKVRMNLTTSRICSLESLRSKDGILFFPRLMMVKSSSSDCFCTSAEPRARRFRFLPSMVSPAPWAPWQAEHFAL